MVKSFIAVGFVTVAISLSTIAEAKKGKGRPHMCDQFTESTIVVDGVSEKVAICTDGAKPVVLTSYIVTTVKNDEGNNVRVALGYR